MSAESSLQLEPPAAGPPSNLARLAKGGNRLGLTHGRPPRAQKKGWNICYDSSGSTMLKAGTVFAL